MPQKRRQAANAGTAGPQQPTKRPKRGQPPQTKTTRGSTRTRAKAAAATTAEGTPTPGTTLGNQAEATTSTEIIDAMSNENAPVPGILYTSAGGSTTPTTTPVINHPSRPAAEEAVSDNVNDSTARLVNAIISTLNSVRDASSGGGNPYFVNRMTTARELPTFSGDPLEWLRFKQAYVSSSASGGFTDAENITRLFNALQGEARGVVNTSLATGSDAASIMDTLELNFGNNRAVAEKILRELRGLPEIKSGKIALSRFSTKVKDAVRVFKSFNMIGYLYNPELAETIGKKLPWALQYAYNKFAATLPTGKSELEKLSEFLHSEVELAAAGGIFNDNAVRTTQYSNDTRRAPRQYATVHAAAHDASSPPSDVEVYRGKMYNCVICREGTHHPSKCALFLSESVGKRWTLAKARKLCFLCLRLNHRQGQCNARDKCSTCDAPHHRLLHRDVAGNYAASADVTRERESRAVSGPDYSGK